MTDFLARIAARAVGQGPALRPRVSPLVVPDIAGAAPDLEVVDEEAVAPAAGRPGAQPQASSAARPEGARPGEAASPAPPGAAPRARGVAASAGAEPGPDEGTTPMPRRAEPGPDDGAPRRASPRPPVDPEPAVGQPLPLSMPAIVRTERREPVVAAPRGRAPEAVPSAPLTPVTPPRGAPAAAQHDHDVADAAAPVIRIHIGRLDVRADLERPVPSGAAAPEPRADDERLSLADYLRGERHAR